MRVGLFAAIVLCASITGCGARTSRDRGADAPLAAPVAGQPITVTLEAPGMGALPSAFFNGALYYAGHDGQQYAIRIGNNTPERVEVVVTVDGRDVVSGQIGDYAEQRGYIIEPYGQIVVDGFRQSMDRVAAFRFSGFADSYTARQGTPQHAGVIGVALFEERAPRKQKTGPLAARPADAPPAPFPESTAGESSRRAAPSSAPEPFARAVDKAEAAPTAAAEDAEGAARSSSSPGGFAPPPAPVNELGTRYGESTSSAVDEVEFKRKHKRRPDAVFAIYYDSERGLANRGVPLGSSPPVFSQPEPFPQRFPTR
jgi:hypothetical protein